MHLTLRLVSGALQVEVDGRITVLSAERLRAACRCAACRAQMRAGAPAIPAQALSIDDLREIGAYAAQLVFSDGHDRGIYPLPYLRELARGVTSPAH